MKRGSYSKNCLYSQFRNQSISDESITEYQRNGCNSCGRNLDMVDLQKRKVELEIENLKLRNTLITLEIQKMQGGME